ncbi:uncharacterized protein LOC100678819 isoform X1 [Nasonia vitripennis]|uniref:Uncharacterized protein n=1 Tax=Nasonia vitripennis TaxID=7425 RepID=A0A7M7GEX9_NASVI|nr:uncharacterized protein LOC100678819 isoform X1 [Nasonia vitripennis]
MSRRALYDEAASQRGMEVGLPVLLVVALTATMAAAAEQQQQQQSSELSRAAAAQLQRLAPFRRSTTLESQPIGVGKASRDKAAKEARNTRANSAEQSLRIPIDLGELYRIFSDSFGAEPNNVRDKRDQPVQLTPARMEALDKYADKIMQDERVQSYMQERIKRDGYGGGYAGAGGGSGLGGSGAFVSGLAGQLVGSVVGLSSTASKGSSSSSGQSPAPVYGPPAYHSYGKESFSIWDFKRAILNTLIQAVKAIGGGVLALKGQLIKGSGFLVSTKGRIISSAGDAITGLGKSLAASAVVQPPSAPHPGYGGGHVGYAYEAPAAHVIAHDSTYDGPPPATNAYHSTFGAASDDESIQPGLLIGKPSPSIDYHTEQLQPGHYDTDIQHAEPHQLTEQVQIEEAEAPKPSFNIKDVVGNLAGTSNFYQADNLKAPEIQSVDEPPAIPPGNALQLQEHNQQDNYELYPPLGNGPDDDKTAQQPPKYEPPPVNFKNPDEYAPAPQNVAYGPPPPSKYGAPDAHPHYNYPQLRPQIQAHSSPDIHIEISDHDITGFESGGYAQHRQPHPPGLHVVAMQGPLKIPILGPEYYKPAPGGYGHLNSIPPMGKLHTRYRPDFEVQKSLEYELRKRRADSLRTHRI